MSEYDYLNARVRGMSTTLLTRDFYEQALVATADNVLVDTLLASPYGAELQEALAAQGAQSGAMAVETAITRNARQAFTRLLSMRRRARAG